MARIRSIHPKIWTDENFLTLSGEAGILLLALGTYSDYADRFPWDLRAMEAHCGWAWSADALEELLTSGLITSDGYVGEIHFAYGFPRKRISKWENLRSLVFIRDGYACQYCGSLEKPLHCDHVVPVSRGGSNELSNLVTACAPCNLSKHDKLLSEWVP